jgi:hypothetical protein
MKLNFSTDICTIINNLNFLKMKKQNFLLGLLVSVVSFSVNAQDSNQDAHNVVIGIPEVALLDLEAANGTSITLGPTAPVEAGEAVAFNSTNNSIWINYSSIIGSTTEPSRNVAVQITSGTVPAGTVLSVLAASDAGTGDGTVGAPTPAVTLTSTAQNIITGIGSAYTGNGVNKGHNLSYALNLASAAGSYAQLDFDNSDTVVITYTLSDN